LTALGFDIGGTAVKAALVRDGITVATARSPSYARPSTEQLVAAMRACVVELASPEAVTRVGLCLPGVLDPDRLLVELCVNIPAIQSVPLVELVEAALPGSPRPTVFGDAHAAGFGYWHDNPGSDRLLALALGTGVGACVLDNGKLFRVTGQSSGHIGQLDVGFCGLPGEEEPIGSDGGCNSLEAWIGVPALRTRYGHDLAPRVADIDINEPPLRALVRAIRICHAIYHPQRVALLGGVGIRLAPKVEAIKQAVDQNLTSVADPSWTLETGTSDHHAAAGAALLALD
jgi:predicted NBD/HSP70 family sugar kinase